MKNKGFTLIEVIIVITIISLLISIIVPNYIYYNKRAVDAKAISYGNIIFQETLSEYCAGGEINTSALKNNLIDISNLESIEIEKIDSKKFLIKFKVNNNNYSDTIEIDKKTCSIKDGANNEISRL